MPRLKLIHPDQSRTEYEFGQHPVTIGRHEDNMVVIENNAVSRHHAIIEPVNGGWQIKDLGSSNGTFRKGQRFETMSLTDRFSFEIGAVKFRFFLAAGELVSSKDRISEQSRSSSSPLGARKRSSKRSNSSTLRRGLSESGSSQTNVLGPAGQAASDGLVGGRIAPDSVGGLAVTDGMVKPQVVPAAPAGSVDRFVDRKWVALIVVVGMMGGAWLFYHRDSSPAVVQHRPPTPLSSKESRTVVVQSQQTVKPAESPVPKANAPVAMREPEPPGVPSGVVRPSTPSASPQAERSRQNSRVLYTPDAEGSEFEPVLSPRLDQVLHVKRAGLKGEGDGLVDVFLNDKPVLHQVKIVMESQLRFSEDGSGWAVLAQNKEGKRFIVSRDKRAEIGGEVIQWTGNRDFSHLAVVVRSHDEDTLFIDGKSVSSYHHIREVRMSEDGRKWAYVAAKDFEGGGQRVVSQDGAMDICERIESLEMAPASGHLVWVEVSRDGGARVMTQNRCIHKIPPESPQEVQSIAITRDGSRLAWAVVPDAGDPVFYLDSGEKWVFPVSTRGAARTSALQRQHPVTRILFNSDGRRFAFAAAGVKSIVMREGKQPVEHPLVSLDSMVMSQDGRRLAYVVLEPDMASVGKEVQHHVAELWVDDKPMTSHRNAWVRSKNDDGAILIGGLTGIQFSPDGRRLAYLRVFPAGSALNHVRRAWVDRDAVDGSWQNGVDSLAWIDSNALAICFTENASSRVQSIIHRIPSLNQP